MERHITSGRRCSRGATLIALLVLIAVIGVGSTLAVQSWTTRIRREKEAELLFRGLAYKHALDSYARMTPLGAPRRPASLDALLVDDRFPYRVRHLRSAYTDPMTGAAFSLLLDEHGRIRGVAGTDRRAPLRVTGFPDEVAAFELAKSYEDWRFVSTD